MTITINEAVISKTETFYPKIMNTKDGKQYLIFNISKKFSQRDENTETGWGKPKYINFKCDIWEAYLIEKFMQHFENGMFIIDFVYSFTLQNHYTNIVFIKYWARRSYVKSIVLVENLRKEVY